MSDESDFTEERNVPVVFLCILVVLLVLLAAAIWVAFFSALRKALKRFAEIKRYRRRQNVLAAIANRSMNDRRAIPNVFTPFPLGYDQSIHNAYVRQVSVAALNVPPSYEEAMSQCSVPVSTFRTTMNNNANTSAVTPVYGIESNDIDDTGREQRQNQLSHLV